jgi:hypothetical protein
VRRDRRLFHKLLFEAYHLEKLSARTEPFSKSLNSDEHFERPFSFMAMKGNYRIRKNMNKTLAEKAARASRFPERLMNP